MYKILIAEDDKSLRELFVSVLVKNGYSVTGVSDGKEALSALLSDYYDLVISDIMMPEMDGYELVEKMRAGGINAPVLMVTAKDSFDDISKGFRVGTDDYMVKPVNVNEMVLRVGALIRRAEMSGERKVTIGSTLLSAYFANYGNNQRYAYFGGRGNPSMPNFKGGGSRGAKMLYYDGELHYASSTYEGTKFVEAVAARHS